MKHTKHNKITSYYLKFVVISIILLTTTLDASAQKSFKSFEISSDVTGSGLGGNICMGMGLNHGNSSLNFGVNFQRQKFNLSGMQINYRYTVFISEKEKVELFFSGNLTVHTSAHISQKSVKIEQSNQPAEPSYNYGALSLKVIESYVGFGLKFNHTKKISTVFNTGFGGFGTVNKNYDRKMYREKYASAFQLRFALIYSFKNS